MLNCPECVNSSIPEEYRPVTEKLFPAVGFPVSHMPTKKAILDFACILGIDADYRKCLEMHENGRDLKDFLSSFENNLELLIQKTWVEKADEFRKENLLDRVPVLIAAIESADYAQALEEFGGILEELAYLFFGAQSAKDDFTEYTFRIDTQMGLFWWYVSRLSSLSAINRGQAVDKSVLLAILLLGICYLTNF
jgi:hypothetical protein